MKLIVCPGSESEIRVLELLVDQFGDGGADALERYGRSWAKIWPGDIVMLVEDEVIEQNLKIYEKESHLAFEILRQNRHNMITGEWYGPNPEPEEGT